MVHSKGRGDVERLMKVPLMAVATGARKPIGMGQHPGVATAGSHAYFQACRG